MNEIRVDAPKITDTERFFCSLVLRKAPVDGRDKLNRR